MALWQRRPKDVIHHSDQGSQHTSIAFGLRCKKAGVRPSTGSVGDCFDNAMCERFFATAECELLDHHCFRTYQACLQRRALRRQEAQRALFEYIDLSACLRAARRQACYAQAGGWYNPHRRHSALGYDSPTTYEEKTPDMGLTPKPKTVYETGITPGSKNGSQILHKDLQCANLFLHTSHLISCSH